MTNAPETTLLKVLLGGGGFNNAFLGSANLGVSRREISCMQKTRLLMGSTWCSTEKYAWNTPSNMDLFSNSFGGKRVASGRHLFRTCETVVLYSKCTGVNCDDSNSMC